MSSVRRTSVSLLLACAVGLVACTSQEEPSENGQDDQAFLKVRTTAISQASRSLTAVTGQSLAVDAVIGITLKGADTPADYAYSNVPYTLESIEMTETSATEQWTTPSDIILRRPKATLTAYYPYDEQIDPYAVNINGMDGIDWLYCPWTTEVISARWPDVTLTMHHAQAILRVELRREGYAGEGKLKFIKIASTALAMQGVFNTSTGSYTTTSGTSLIDQQYAEGEELQLPADPNVICSDEWFFLPVALSSSEDVDITFTVKVDKRSLETTTTISPSAFQCGRIHLFPLKVMNSELEVSPVTIIPWETQDDSHNMKPTN